MSSTRVRVEIDGVLVFVMPLTSSDGFLSKMSVRGLEVVEMASWR